MQDVDDPGGTSPSKAVAQDDSALYEPTLLLQEFLQLSDEFTRMLSGELDVNATDFRAMEHLLRAGSLTPGELSQRLGLSGAAVTTSVDRLVRRGHVSRELDSADRRRVRVIPAPASTYLAASFVTPMVRDLDAELHGFSAAEQRAITDYLRRVVATLRRHAQGTPSEETDDGARPGRSV